MSAVVLACMGRLRAQHSHPTSYRSAGVHWREGGRGQGEGRSGRMRREKDAYYKNTAMHAGIFIRSKLEFVQYPAMIDEAQLVAEPISLACWAYKSDHIIA